MFNFLPHMSNSRWKVISLQYHGFIFGLGIVKEKMLVATGFGGESGVWLDFVEDVRAFDVGDWPINIPRQIDSRIIYKLHIM